MEKEKTDSFWFLLPWSGAVTNVKDGCPHDISVRSSFAKHVLAREMKMSAPLILISSHAANARARGISNDITHSQILTFY
jgi:hypothetical protein